MIRKEDIFVNESHWRDMSDVELDDFKNIIFTYYRENGFPYYNKLNNNKEFDNFIKYDISNLITNDGIVKQTMHGLGLLWSYFPHAFEVKCNNKLSPLEAFNNDEIFKKIITKRLKHGTYISNSGILKTTKLFSGVQSVSNFRPSAAAAIYNKYANNGIVWDMSSGWGGRLLGAIKSNVKKYIGTEPSLKTYEGLYYLKKDFGSFRKDLAIELHLLGSEEYFPEKNSLDLCFTSPPYFNTEKYSNEISQSYIKYPDYTKWIDGYLTQTIRNCHYGLKRDGVLAINIAKTKQLPTIENDMLIVANNNGFKLVDILKLALSNPNMRNKTNAFKYEPIFIFKKK